MKSWEDVDWFNYRRTGDLHGEDLSVFQKVWRLYGTILRRMYHESLFRCLFEFIPLDVKVPNVMKIFHVVAGFCQQYFLKVGFR